MNYRKPELRSALAGEYALGTMTGLVRRRFESLMDDDPVLRGEVESWQQKLAPLAESLPEQMSSPRVWENIEHRIKGRAVTKPASTASMWLNFRFWRSWALAASTVAAALVMFIGIAPQQTTTVDYMVVITDDAQSRASWVVSGRADSNVVKVKTLAPQPIPSNRSFQLWVLPSGESKVRPVGLIPASGQTTLELNRTISELLGDAQKFGVSIEAPEGSPTGQPTTTPLYHGTPLAL